MLLPLLVLAPIGIGILIFILHPNSYKTLGLIAQVLMVVLTAIVFIRIDIIHQSPIITALSNVASIGAIHLYADAISALLLVLTSFIYLMAFLYACHKPFFTHQFLFLLLTLEGLIVGIFLAQDLFTLYALIEVSTIVISILIMYKKDRIAIYEGLVYLLANIVAMAFYLMGIGYIYKLFGTLDLLKLSQIIPTITDSRMLIVPYAFIITAIALKSAVVPMFSWLPHAYAESAPFIVSAILSGLHIKASLYLFLRIQNIFGTPMNTHRVFLILGLVTAFVGAFIAISQKNIKRLLAYSTISQIGLIVISLSSASLLSYYGAVYHIINHALFKGVMFLIAGLIIESYGTTNIDNIKGLWRRMPLVTIAMIVAILGITGAPLFNGSISKYLIQQGLASHSALEYVIVLINLSTMAYLIKFIPMLFDYPSSASVAVIKPLQKTVILTLSTLSLLGGLLGHFLVNLFFGLTVTWTLWDYLEKTVIYLLSLFLSWIFYEYIYKRRRLFKAIREFQLTFNELVLTIVIFFGGMMVYLVVTV